jgi:hypothetical protein
MTRRQERPNTGYDIHYPGIQQVFPPQVWEFVGQHLGSKQGHSVSVFLLNHQNKWLLCGTKALYIRGWVYLTDDGGWTKQLTFVLLWQQSPWVH